MAMICTLACPIIEDPRAPRPRSWINRIAASNASRPSSNRPTSVSAYPRVAWAAASMDHTSPAAARTSSQNRRQSSTGNGPHVYGPSMNSHASFSSLRSPDAARSRSRPGQGLDRLPRATEPEHDHPQPESGECDSGLVPPPFELVADALDLGGRQDCSLVGSVASSRITRRISRRPSAPSVPGGPDFGEPLLDRLRRAVQVARLVHGPDEHGQRPRPIRRAGREQVDAPAQQVGRRRVVAASQGALPRREQQAGRAGGDPRRPVVGRPQLQAVPRGLLEVVPDDLLVLRHAVAGHPLEPVGEALVELRPGLLRHRRRRRRRGSAGGGTGRRPRPASVDRLGPDQLLAHERHQVRAAPSGAPAPATSSATAPAPELLAHDGRRARSPRARRSPAGRGGRRAAPGSSAGPPRGEVAGRRPAAVLADEQAVVDQHRQHLLDEQRVALGAPRRCGRAASGAEPGRAEQVLDQARRPRRRRAARAGSTPRCASRRPTPAGRRAAPAGPGRAAGSARPATSRRGARSGRGSVGSAQWMSSNTTTSGRCVGERLEQPADRPERLLGRARLPRRRRAARRPLHRPSRRVAGRRSSERARRRARRRRRRRPPAARSRRPART